MDVHENDDLVDRGRIAPHDLPWLYLMAIKASKAYTRERRHRSQLIGPCTPAGERRYKRLVRRKKAVRVVLLRHMRSYDMVAG